MTRQRAMLAWSTALLGTFLLAAAACGGDSAAAAPIIPPNQADAFVHAALIQVPDLGPGWVLVADDNFAAPAGGTSCEPASPDDAEKQIAAGRLARARRNMNLDLPGKILTVQVDVAVYKDEATAKAAVDSRRATTGSPEYEKCIQDHFASAGHDSALEAVKSDSTIPTANGGFGMVFTLRPPGGAAGPVLRSEAHVWHAGNIVFGLQAVGAEANASVETVRTLLGRFGARALLATTPVPASSTATTAAK